MSRKQLPVVSALLLPVWALQLLWTPTLVLESNRTRRRQTQRRWLRSLAHAADWERKASARVWFWFWTSTRTNALLWYNAFQDSKSSVVTSCRVHRGLSLRFRDCWSVTKYVTALLHPEYEGLIALLVGSCPLRTSCHDIAALVAVPPDDNRLPGACYVEELLRDGILLSALCRDLRCGLTVPKGLGSYGENSSESLRIE